MQPDLSTLSEIFKFLDRDNDGILSQEDLQLSLGALDISIDDFDKDPTGYDLPLFLATINSHLSIRKPISTSTKDAFKMLVTHHFPQNGNLIPMEKLHSLMLDYSEKGCFSQQDWIDFASIANAISAVAPDPNNPTSMLLDHEKLVDYFS